MVSISSLYITIILIIILGLSCYQAWLIINTSRTFKKQITRLYTLPRTLLFTHLFSRRLIWVDLIVRLGLPWWLSGKESACQCPRCRRHKFNPWVGKIPWRRKWQPILAYKIPWTEEPGGLLSLGSQSWTQLSTWAWHSEIE